MMPAVKQNDNKAKQQLSIEWQTGMLASRLAIKQTISKRETEREREKRKDKETMSSNRQVELDRWIMKALFMVMF